MHHNTLKVEKKNEGDVCENSNLDPVVLSLFRDASAFIYHGCETRFHEGPVVKGRRL